MDEEFLSYFEQEKVTSWDNYYINYRELFKGITKLFETELDSVKIEEKKQKLVEFDEKNDAIIKEMKNIPLFKNNINNNINNVSYDNTNSDTDSSFSKNKIKPFFDLLDKEIKKIYNFYSSKEKDLYQNINKKIQNKENIKKKSCNEIIKEIDELEYLSNLCLELLEFIYLNILALKNILNTLDNIVNTQTQSISYNYLKKYLSQDNSDLIYILSFKILDETNLAIQGLFSEYGNCLKKNEEYNNNIELKTEYNEHKNNINNNFINFDETHEKLFNELTVWQKYLDINLDLPSSSNNSIFKDTTFVGDNSEKTIRTMSKRKVKKKKNSNKDNYLIGTLDMNLLDRDNLMRDFSDIFSNQEDLFSKDSKHLLSRENLKNIQLFYILVFFYFYSYFVVISKVLYILKIKFQGFEIFYGIIISLPSLGSLISQLYITRIIKCNFKCVLIKSLFLVFCHYFLYILGIYQNDFYLLLIARFLLGLSSLDRLCKIYIDQCIPVSKQVKSNKKYLRNIYVGYIFGLIASYIEMIIVDFIFNSENKKYDDKYKFEYLYIISGFIFLMLSIIVIFSFKNPNQEKFKMLKDSIIEYNKENRLITRLLDKDEKEEAEKQDNLFQTANILTHLSGENSLNNYSYEIKRQKSSYFTKVFLLLILFLISSLFTCELNLMISLIPRKLVFL